MKTKEDSLIKKLQKYLKEKGIEYYPDSLNFKGKRDGVPQPDGSVRQLYTISYMTSINDNEFDSNAIHYAYFDILNDDLLYILSPQSYHKIVPK